VYERSIRFSAPANCIVWSGHDYAIDRFRRDISAIIRGSNDSVQAFMAQFRTFALDSRLRIHNRPT